MTDWYAVQTKARQESVAEWHLGNQAFNTFLPMLKTTRRKQGKWASVIEPLFPGYLFVELDAATQNWAPIRSTRGVIGLVRRGVEPCPLPDGFVDDLQAAQAFAGDVIDPAAAFTLNKGDTVAIVDGAMAGLEAIVQETRGEARVIVLLNVLGRQTEVAVKAAQLVTVSSDRCGVVEV